MRFPLVVLVTVACLALAGGPASAQEPLFHGVLSVRPASGGIDKDVGTGSLRVKNWEFRLSPDSNGIAPDAEPIILAIGESERLVIPAGQVRASRNGKRFVYRNPKIPRGVRSFEMRRLKNDGAGLARYRVRFSIVGVDFSSLTIQFPDCKSLAVIVGDDDGFTGVDIDRPGGFRGSRVRVLGACTAQEWPWV
jgi:hypothetical protein